MNAAIRQFLAASRDLLASAQQHRCPCAGATAAWDGEHFTSCPWLRAVELVDDVAHILSTDPDTWLEQLAALAEEQAR